MHARYTGTSLDVPVRLTEASVENQESTFRIGPRLIYPIDEITTYKSGKTPNILRGQVNIASTTRSVGGVPRYVPGTEDEESQS